MHDNKADNHGGNIYHAARLYGGEPAGWLDYSANINPLGPPPGLEALLREGMAELAHYPDPECRDLREAIAGYLHLAPEQIIAGNGASEIIALVLEVWQPHSLLLLQPTFSEYASLAAHQGIGLKSCILAEANGFQPDIEKLLSLIDEKTGMLLLCNPNNPTSTLLEKEAIHALLTTAKDKNVKVVIDESFIEMTAAGNANSCSGFLDQFDNLFIIRAFTKVFAIPGLRLGYGLGSPPEIKRMGERKLPWSVNALACRMGKLLTEGSEFLKQTSVWIQTEAKWFYEQLATIEGIKVFPPSANFILIKLLHPAWNAPTLRHQLAGRKILIRNAGNFTALDERYIRLAIKKREDNSRLLKALQEVL